MVIFVGCESFSDKAFDCHDGDTYISYYPNPDGNLIFPGDFSPSEELKSVRVAYWENHACPTDEPEGYFVKENSEFRKVSEEQFIIFIKDYNNSCNGCLSEHFDGCC